MTVFLSKINKMVRLVKKPLGLIPPGRRVSVRESDIFVTSYPKSGNTWVRFLISNMMYPDGSTDFKNVNDRVPDIYTVPSRSLEKYSKPRIMKSHEYFDPRYKKVLYIVRDVRSVIVSYFHHKQLAGSINSNTSIGEFTDLFMAGEIDGFGDWQDNVASWFLLRGDSGDQFKMLKYEEIKNDPYASCEAIYDFLDLEYTPEDVERSVGYSDFGRMKELESKGLDQSVMASKSSKLSTGYVRAGQTNKWMEEIPSEVQQKINDRYGDLLIELGYKVE